jgi:chaperonin GroEL
VDCADPTEQMGSDLVREASQKTDNIVGDGSTATVTLARAMIQSGFDFIKNGANPIALERGLQKAAQAIIRRVQETAVICEGEKIFQVATVAAHGDAEIGRLVSDAVQKAGPNGIVTAEPSSTSETYVETVAGIELLKSNLLHGVFITHPETMSAELADCRILLWEGVIATAKSLVPILKQVAETGTPLIIVAGGYEQEALSVLINNKAKLALPLIAVRMEAYGERKKEVMRDIAALTGGIAYTEDMGMKIESIVVNKLGSARKVITNMSKTQIIDGKGNQAEVAGRVAHIQQCIEAAAPAERNPLRQRLAALLGGITVIKVGDVTLTAMEEKKDRVVDAMSAAKAAVESGIVPGGGTALMQASTILLGLRFSDAEMRGVDVVHIACRAVARQIAENAGISGDLIVAQLMATPDLGYNAASEVFENLVDAGIVDPAQVVIEALRNAASVAGSFITMGCTVAEVQEKPNV